jgi:hypothetical protein
MPSLTCTSTGQPPRAYGQPRPMIWISSLRRDRTSPGFSQRFSGYEIHAESVGPWARTTNPRKSRRVAATAHGAIHASTRPLLVVVVGGLPDIVRPGQGEPPTRSTAPHDSWCPGYRGVAPLPPVAVVQTVGERVVGSAVSGVPVSATLLP